MKEKIENDNINVALIKVMGGEDMANYKLVKIYEEEDKNRIKNILGVTPINIAEKVIMIKYGLSLPYFRINGFMLKEDMDHVILYSENFFKLIKCFLEKKIKIKQIKLLDIQDDIEERIDESLNELDFNKSETIESLLKILEKHIPQSNIDIQYLKIELSNKDEIIIYNNGVLTGDQEDSVLSIRNDLCCGL